MKSPKIHVKVFLGTLLVLVIVEVVAFQFLHSIAVKHIHTTAFKYLSYRTEGFRHVFEQEVRKSGADRFNEDKNFQDFLRSLGHLYKAKICIFSPNGDKRICSTEVTNELISDDELKHFKNFHYKAFTENDTPMFYMKLPLTFPNKLDGSVTLIFDISRVGITSVAERLIVVLFILYLVGIAIGTSLLLFPVAMLISRPIRKLRNSANKIASGDLSHRVITQSNDEIGELGNAFNKMAASVEQMVEGTKELSANISHELRSPLARIRIAQEILRDKVSKENHSHLDMIEDEIGEMDHLISQILLISKLDSEKLSRKSEWLDITEFVRDLLERYAPAIEQKSINLVADLPESSSSIYANLDDMRMAMSNLLDNAIKYTPDNGCIEVTISVDQNHVELFIANTCEQDAQIKFDKLFEPFYRSIGNNVPGTGLGLTITKKIIESYEGEISAALWGDSGIGFVITFNT